MTDRRFWGFNSVRAGTPYIVPPRAPDVRIFLCNKSEPSVTVRAQSLTNARTLLNCEKCDLARENSCTGPILQE